MTHTPASGKDYKEINLEKESIIRDLVAGVSVMDGEIRIFTFNHIISGKNFLSKNPDQGRDYNFRNFLF